jgi:hypothetical protein
MGGTGRQRGGRDASIRDGVDVVWKMLLSASES